MMTSYKSKFDESHDFIGCTAGYADAMASEGTSLGGEGFSLVSIFSAAGVSVRGMIEVLMAAAMCGRRMVSR